MAKRYPLKEQARAAIGAVLRVQPVPITELALVALFRGPVSDAYPFADGRKSWHYRLWLDECDRARKTFLPAVCGEPISVGCPTCHSHAWMPCIVGDGPIVRPQDRTIIAVRLVIRDAALEGSGVAQKLKLETFHTPRVDRYYRRTGEGPTLPLFGKVVAHG